MDISIEKMKTGVNEINKENATIPKNTYLFHIILTSMQEIESGIEQILASLQILGTHASETNGIFTSILESNNGSLENV